ncbi:MAG: hypothetical protein WCW52_03450 [Elusimicrobiales bacterium]|jgi:hypothetical protein
MNRDEFEKLKKRVTRFQNLANAISWSNRGKWPGYIIHGDDGYYWACRPVDFERLIKAGYEAAPIL